MIFKLSEIFAFIFKGIQNTVSFIKHTEEFVQIPDHVLFGTFIQVLELPGSHYKKPPFLQ